MRPVPSLTTLPPSCAVVMKSGNLNVLEPSRPVTGLLYLYILTLKKKVSKAHNLSIITTTGVLVRAESQLNTLHCTSNRSGYLQIYFITKWNRRNSRRQSNTSTAVSKQSCLIKVDGYSRCERDYSCRHFGP